MHFESPCTHDQDLHRPLMSSIAWAVATRGPALEVLSLLFFGLEFYLR